MRLDNRFEQELRLSEAVRRVRAGAGGQSAVDLAGALARLEGVDRDPSLTALLIEARAAATPGAMASAGRAIDLDQLVEDGREAHDARSRRRWLDRAVDLAAVRPWLEARRGEQADTALAMCAAIVLAEPRSWAGVLGHVADGVGLPPFWSDVHDEAALFAVLDARAGEARADRVSAALARARAEAPDLLEAAEDALADLGQRSALRLPRAGEERLAAADGRALELATMLAGRWVYVEEGGRAHVRFEAPEAEAPLVVAVELLEGDAAVPLVVGDVPYVFALPPRAGALTLRLRVGFDSRTLRIGRTDP